MILYYVSEMDMQAIADALYITVSAAKGRLTRGNKALKAMLQEVENEG
jgi:DNA-directed RNA polymerase specialized sigma24 family protein